MFSANFSQILHGAFEKRRSLCAEFAAVRLFDGVGDGCADLCIDRFGDFALAQIYGSSAVTQYGTALAALSEFFELYGVKTLLLRQRGKDSAHNAQTAPVLLFGAIPTSATIEEHQIRYLIDPVRQINAGFFIDMRDLRARIKANALGKKVLNLFCYSGSLGLSALLGGARDVTQVDISKAMLRWANDNQQLNQSVNITGTMRFIPEDSLTFLEREGRRIARGAERYDTIIIDPPSFSRSPAGTFQIERDLGILARGARAIASEHFEIYLTTNLSTLSPQGMKEIIQSSAPELCRAVQFEELFPPRDFPSTGENSIAMRGLRISS